MSETNEVCGACGHSTKHRAEREYCEDADCYCDRDDMLAALRAEIATLTRERDEARAELETLRSRVHE